MMIRDPCFKPYPEEVSSSKLKVLDFESHTLSAKTEIINNTPYKLKSAYLPIEAKPNHLDQAPYAAATLEKLMLDIHAMEEPQTCPWQEAELWSPFHYLRSSKHLEMPSSLKALLVLPS